MTDLIERLEKWAIWCHENNIKSEVQLAMNEAADEIERLQDRNEVLEKSAKINRSIMDSYGPRFDEYDNQIAKLRAALERIAGWGDPDFPADDTKGEADRNYFIYDGMRRIAREALEDNVL